MLDAILLPIGEGNRVLAQISNGKIDELIAQTYKGDHEKMKQAVNNVATALQRHGIRCGNTLTKAALEGKLATRADASKHHGDFRKIVEGVNATLDAVVGPMKDVSAMLTKLAGGDFTAQVTSKYAGDYETGRRRQPAFQHRALGSGTDRTQCFRLGQFLGRAEQSQPVDGLQRG